MAAYYNEIDPFAAQWLRNLIAAGHIAPGDVDERSIEDVQPDDVRPYTQAHFFAGIGVWSYAFRLAGWSDDEPVWSGSCPCQPFSTIGTEKGFDDPRHLWPVWCKLIKECKPSAIFGEQVENAVKHGWLDAVFVDLENTNYACAAANIPAACYADHERERIWFVAYADMPKQDSGRTPGGKQSFRDTNRCAVESRAVQYVRCADGLHRAIEPGAQPLLDGVAARMDKLRAYGNAIQAKVAASFIEAAMDCMPY